MQTRLFALVFGAVYVVVGIAGLIPALYSAPPAGAPHVAITADYGYLLGLFPVNVAHDLIHILVGVLGIICASRVGSARYYSQGLFLVFGLLSIWGFIPTLNTVWGLVPIFGNDSWLHLATALLGGYFGYVALESTQVEPAPAHAH